MIFFNETSLNIYFGISPINKTKYQTSRCVCVRVAHIYKKWTSPNNVLAHVPLSFGLAHWYCFHIKHPSYTNGKLVKLASNLVTNLSCCNFCSVWLFKCSICWAIWLHLKLYCHQWWKDSICWTKIPFPTRYNAPTCEHHTNTCCLSLLTFYIRDKNLE
jgi:hypothetical protein